MSDTIVLKGKLARAADRETTDPQFSRLKKMSLVRIECKKMKLNCYDVGPTSCGVEPGISLDIASQFLLCMLLKSEEFMKVLRIRSKATAREGLSRRIIPTVVTLNDEVHVGPKP